MSRRYVSTRPIPDDSDAISLVPKHQRSSKWVCKKHVVHRWCFLMILWDTWSNCHFNKLFHKSFFFITNPSAKNDSSVLAFVYLCANWDLVILCRNTLFLSNNIVIYHDKFRISIVMKVETDIITKIAVRSHWMR